MVTLSSDAPERRLSAERITEIRDTLERHRVSTITPAPYQVGQRVYVSDVSALLAHLDALTAELARVAAENAQLRAAVEPGTASAIVAGLFREAERLGHSPASSVHALTYLAGELDRLREVEAERDVLRAALELLSNALKQSPAGSCAVDRWSTGEGYTEHEREIWPQEAIAYDAIVACAALANPASPAPRSAGEPRA